MISISECEKMLPNDSVKAMTQTMMEGIIQMAKKSVFFLIYKYKFFAISSFAMIEKILLTEEVEITFFPDLFDLLYH